MADRIVQTVDFAHEGERGAVTVGTFSDMVKRTVPDHVLATSRLNPYEDRRRESVHSLHEMRHIVRLGRHVYRVLANVKSEKPAAVMA